MGRHRREGGEARDKHFVRAREGSKGCRREHCLTDVRLYTHHEHNRPNTANAPDISPVKHILPSLPRLRTM